MNIFISPLVDWVILITGIINLVTALPLFFTCRFIPGSRLTKGWMHRGWYVYWYRYHSYIWWLFAPSLIIHAVIAILHRLAGG